MEPALQEPVQPKCGDDLQYQVKLKFEDEILGSSHHLQPATRMSYSSGAKKGQASDCHKCHGSGVINVQPDLEKVHQQLKQVSGRLEALLTIAGSWSTRSSPALRVDVHQLLLETALTYYESFQRAA